ncbi:MAG: RIP metalloprotease RseP [Rhodobacteraceae bacterium]|nr:RIP metalloprotease RseP [Paracoccaceae bacterium]
MDFVGLIPSFGNALWTVAAFVVALSIIVAIHEFGHYIVGRWSGIHAEVFSIGFGPALLSRTDRHGTRWQLAAIPLGGYVKFLGDANAASSRPDEATLRGLSAEERRHTMHGAPLWARAATVVAGPVANFILSIAVFAGLFLWAGQATEVPTVGEVRALPGGPAGILPGDVILAVEGRPTPDVKAIAELFETLPPTPSMTYLVRRGGAELTVPGPTLYPSRASAVQPLSAAFEAGIKAGDVITAADGRPIFGFIELQQVVREAGGSPVNLEVWSPDGTTRGITLSPRVTDIPREDGGFETRYLIGLYGDGFFEQARERVSPLRALTGAVRQTWDVASTSVSMLGHMIQGAISACNLRGPITIARTSGATASQGLYEFIAFIAALSTAVGLLNLFPIPMLDGGHLLFHAWEWARGRPPSDRMLNVLMTVGLSVVIALMLFGLKNDIFCP